MAGGNGGGIGTHQLGGPNGLIFDSFSNSLIIANYDTNTVVRWTLGALNWSLVGGVSGVAGNTASLLNGPVGIAMDPMGNIYVADSANHRVQLFMNGQLQAQTIAGSTGVFGTNATLFSYPVWVQLDRQLNLYVSDFLNGRIQKFMRY